MTGPYVDPREDLETRDPEWVELESGHGQDQTRMRKIEWDPIHNELRVTGPKIVVEPPERPK